MRFWLMMFGFLVACGGAAKDGAKGPEGADGEPCTVVDTADGATISCPDGTSVDLLDGSPGADGTDNRIAASLFCTGSLEGTPLYFDYQAVVLASGDVFAYGAIRGSSFGVGASTFYSGEQNGALTAQVLIASDNAAPANGGWWAITLNRETAVTSIAYNDVNVPGGQDTWTMAPAACVVNNY